jgi:hypothetical protein
LVLVEYHHNDTGDTNVHWANVEQIIKWATRCLYLEIALFVFVSTFYLNHSFTFAFLGAILGMFYLHLIWSKEREVPESNDVHKCTLEYISEQSST